MDHYDIDPEVRFGASTIEDGQTFTTTLQDQNTHDPRDSSHQERPHSVRYEVQVADLREQISSTTSSDHQPAGHDAAVDGTYAATTDPERLKTGTEKITSTPSKAISSGSPPA